MDSTIILVNVHIAGVPTFFPSLTDPKKHRCLVTAMKNRGKNDAGQEMTDEFTLVFWGKYAQTAAIFLDKGRCINVEAVARPYTVDTGQVKPGGKRILQRITNFAVRSFEFGGDTKKELLARITANIHKAKEQGLLPPDTTITAEFLIDITRPAHYDYNPALAASTGKYGNANVWVKGSGFVAPSGAPAPGTSIEELEANLLAMKKAKEEAEKVKSESVAEETAVMIPDVVEAGAEGAAEVADPFTAAA